MPTIMLTGHPDIPNAVGLTRSGRFDYLTKPFGVKTFHECLRRAIARLSQARTDIKVLDFLGRSPATEEVRRLIFQAAANPSATVLLTGETGVGKDLAARVIHELTSQNKTSAPPLISLNCSTLPSEMFEAELFGAEKGADTGAHQQRSGLAEAAQDETLFLDEIAEVPFSLQAKLLQFLETRDYRRLGSTQPRHFEVRLIAATNKPLEEEVKQGRFRADLWYRLDVFTIHVPPPSEIARRIWKCLTEFLVSKLAQKYGRTKPNVKPDNWRAVEAYDFPGNVRELRNLLERSLLQTPPEANWLEMDRAWLRKMRLSAPPLSMGQSEAPDHPLSPLEDQEYVLIQKVLKEENGVIRRAAAQLGISNQSLLRRLEKWPQLRPHQGP